MKRGLSADTTKLGANSSSQSASDDLSTEEIELQQEIELEKRFQTFVGRFLWEYTRTLAARARR